MHIGANEKRETSEYQDSLPDEDQQQPGDEDEDHDHHLGEDLSEKDPQLPDGGELQTGDDNEEEQLGDREAEDEQVDVGEDGMTMAGENGGGDDDDARSNDQRTRQSCDKIKMAGLPRGRIGDTVNASCYSGLFDGN